MTPIITLHPDVDLTPEDNASIDRWIDAMFPWDDGDHHDGEHEHDEAEFSAPYYYFRVWEDEAAQSRGEWVSLVAVTDRTIRVGGQSVRVGGIGGVSTREDRRKRGYASMAMREAARFMFADLGVPFGMLFCGPHRIPFYESLGWQAIHTPIPVHNEAHFLILSPDGSAWPAGDVDLLGLSW
jgi:GNAT superfamily N-acetyltransferase